MPRSVGKRGFTLVELLVVVAVIALLLGLLLPALSKAREQGRLMVCLNNMRDITMAANSYAADQDGLWPVMPCLVLPDGRPLFSSWQYGGKTTSDYWISYGSGTFKRIDERPLNPYVAPDTILKDPQPGERLELTTYRCPSDPGTLQRSFWNSNTIPDPRVTCYDDVGTSYHLNVQWWYNGAIPNNRGVSTVKLWQRYSNMFKLANFQRPSLFAWNYDQTMDLVAVGGYNKLGDHGGHNRATVSFMDGHVNYTEAKPKQLTSDDYTLTIDRKVY